MINPALAALVVTFMASEIPSTERDCLALNIYHEARNQSHLGQVAVAQVVLNRVDDGRFPNSICNVIHQQRFVDPPGAPIRLNQCQFSWYCDGKSDAPTDEIAWYTAQEHAAHAYYLYDLRYDVTEGSTHYHSSKVEPNWIPDMIHIVDIDDHKFYRWE